MSDRSDKQAAIEALERIFENYHSKDLSNSALPVLTDYDVWADYFLIREYLDSSIYSNADRIREMTDEELAEFFTSEEYDGNQIFFCPADVKSHDCVTANCPECFLKWLKQEVTKNETD